MFPQTNLQPGMSGDSVKQLQNFLISQGIKIPDGATGYYGPETKSAVSQWQQKNNVQAGSNAGYWGPLSISAAKNETTKNSTTANTQTNGNSSTTSSTPQGVPYDPNLAKYGITQDLWNQGNAIQQAIWASLGNVVNLANQTPISSLTMQEALTQAQNDPNITKPYADTLGIDTNILKQSLDQTQTAISTTAQQQQQQFEKDRKALAEQEAAAGTAYSGFRGKAQQDLAQSESGIVTSSRAQLQNNLNQLSSSFESKYGTAATPAVTANFIDPYASANTSISGLHSTSGDSISTLTGQTTGGVTGSQANAPGGSEYQAINSAAANSYKTGILPT